MTGHHRHTASSPDLTAAQASADQHMHSQHAQVEPSRETHIWVWNQIADQHVAHLYQLLDRIMAWLTVRAHFPLAATGSRGMAAQKRHTPRAGTVWKLSQVGSFLHCPACGFDGHHCSAREARCHCTARRKMLAHDCMHNGVRARLYGVKCSLRACTNLNALADSRELRRGRL